jgi:hypothetical protein
MMNDFKPLVIKGAGQVVALDKAFAQKQKQKVARTPATECNYNKEYFANKECHSCGKKWHPARCCTNKKGKAKKECKDDKSVSDSKLIESLTKKGKTLKKLVSVLQAHQADSKNNSSLSNEDEEAHFQYECVAIKTTNPKVAMALKSNKAQNLDLRSVWLLDNQSTFDLCSNPDFTNKRCNAKREMNMSSNQVVCVFPRNV